MSERTIADEIVDIAKAEISQIPVNKQCTIISDYPNTPFVDIQLLNGETMKYLQCIGSTEVGSTAVLVFTDGNTDNPIVINSSVNADVDLNDYVKKVDLVDKTKYDIDFNVVFGSSGMDDIITLDWDIVNHIVNKRIIIGGNNNGN